MRIEGRIVTWKDRQGYGFIAPDNGGPQYFVHVKAFLDGAIRPEENERVSFEAARDEQGRPLAKYVRREGAAFRIRTVEKVNLPVLLFAGIFLCGVAAVGATGRVPPHFAALYAGLSLLTFVLYRRDKSAAEAGRWRTPESTLHLLALAGGWPGAIAAQQLLRHKSRKASFQLVFWLTVAGNLLALALLTTPLGDLAAQALRRELGQ